MSKKMKKRVIIGVLAFVALLGAGAVFASLNAGEQLRTWYDAIFSGSSGNVKSAADAYAEDQNKKLSQDYGKIKDAAVGDVRQTGIDETAKAIDDVNKAAQEYIDSINQAKSTLSAETQLRFDALVKDYIDKFNVSADTAKQLALADLEKSINSEGKKAQDNANEIVSDTRDKAKANLEKAIQDAKEELRILIAQEEQAATAELKKQIAAKIQLVLSAIQEKAKLLEDTNKAQIQAAALKAVNNAKEELDAVVASIPNAK